MLLQAETPHMGKKRKTSGTGGPEPAKSEQYRKPFRQIRIRLRLAEVGEEVSGELEQDLTQFVNDALRERLERLGRWPPKLP